MPPLNEKDRRVLRAAGEQFNRCFDVYGSPRRSAVKAITKKLGLNADDPGVLDDTHMRLKFLKRNKCYGANA
jgi:hypothetical protein